MGFWHVEDGRLRPGLAGGGAESPASVEVVPVDEAEPRFPGLAAARMLAQLPFAEVSFAEEAGGAVVGVVVLPSRSDPSLPSQRWCFSVERGRLVMAEDGPFCSEALDRLERDGVPVDSARAVLAEVLRETVRDETVLLSHLAEKVQRAEETVLADGAGVDRKAMHRDKRLAFELGMFYQSMEDLVEAVAEGGAAPADGEARARLESLSRHFGRLATRVQTLHEQCVQLDGLYRDQVAARQNRVMQWLTVVATIFMPLTFVTSWYGMNFPNMGLPGREWGYIVVIAVCVVIAVVEVLWFRSKGWLSFKDKGAGDR